MDNTTHASPTLPRSAEIQIDPTFKVLIPPLSDDERQQLEANIVAERGSRDPLVIWRETGILLDGHNRHEICTRLGLGYKVATLSFPDRESAMDWIDRNQLGRRNLTAEGASLLRGRLYTRAKRREGAPAGNQNATKQLDQIDPVVSGSTAARLAEQFGVSEPTIKRDGAFATAVEAAKALDPEIEQKVIAGTAPSKSAVIEAAKVIDTEPERAKAILSGKKPAESPANPAEPWSEFNREMQAIISDLRSLNHRLGKLLEYDAGTKQIRSRWAHYYSHAGTVGQVNALIRDLNHGTPAEASDREGPHGYLSAGRLEVLRKLKAA